LRWRGRFHPSGTECRASRGKAKTPRTGGSRAGGFAGGATRHGPGRVAQDRPAGATRRGGGGTGRATQEKYAASVADPEAFWGEEGKRIDWIKPYTKVKNTSFAPGNVSIKWFEDGTLNVAANCVDRHLATRGDQTAIIWEPDDPKVPAKHITYRELHRETSARWPTSSRTWASGRATGS
jgi:hypothetical protein